MAAKKPTKSEWQTGFVYWRDPIFYGGTYDGQANFEDDHAVQLSFGLIGEDDNGDTVVCSGATAYKDTVEFMDYTLIPQSLVQAIIPLKPAIPPKRKRKR